MADPRVIAVVGATGAQGGGLARAILDDPDGGFACRALTRNPASAPARALAELGAEVVQADLEPGQPHPGTGGGVWRLLHDELL